MKEEFESPLDKIIREARERGEFDDLPGKGKPLQWEDESQVPESQRLANRLLRNNGFTLDWIELGRELDGQYEKLRAGLESDRQRRADGRLSEAGWQAAQEKFRDQVRELNRRVVGYNVRTPHEQFHKRPYPLE